MTKFLQTYLGVNIGDCSIGIVENNSELLRFECFSIFALDGSAGYAPLYIAQGHRHAMRDFLWEAEYDLDEGTINLDEAAPFLTGHIAVDGTTELTFPFQPLFSPNRRATRKLTKLFDRLYEIASELLEDFHDYSCGDS